MATIKDYLRWRGDLSVDVAPFNVVDNILLAALAYVDLAGTGANGPQGTTLAAACETLLAASDAESLPVRSMVAVDAELLRLVADSRRLGAGVAHDYVDETDDAIALQFSAVTVDLGERLSAVVFRGTDHSLVGWREDFLLGCMVTQAQLRAAAYLRAMAGRAAAEGRSVVVCGHSKGGNLAAYAACECPAHLRRHIAHVWSDDGPGMAREVAPCDVAATLGVRYTHVVPTYSIVGMLFLPPDDPLTVIESKASGFLQHDLTTWQVGPNDVVRAEALSAESTMVAEAFATWLDGLALPQRERFVNELFDALAAGDPDRIDAVLASPAAVRRVLVATAGMSATTKGVARRLFDVARRSVASAASSAAGRAVSDATTTMRELAAAGMQGRGRLR